MKLHKGDKVEIHQKDFNTRLEIKLNGFVQFESDHEYMLKRCGYTKGYCLSIDYPLFITIQPTMKETNNSKHDYHVTGYCKICKFHSDVIKTLHIEQCNAPIGINESVSDNKEAHHILRKHSGLNPDECMVLDDFAVAAMEEYAALKVTQRNGEVVKVIENYAKTLTELKDVPVAFHLFKILDLIKNNHE